MEKVFFFYMWASNSFTLFQAWSWIWEMPTVCQVQLVPIVCHIRNTVLRNSL